MNFFKRAQKKEKMMYNLERFPRTTQDCLLLLLRLPVPFEHTSPTTLPQHTAHCV